MHLFIYNKQTKTKTVLTEGVVEITYNHNKSNHLNDKLKRSSTQLNENLVVLCRYKHTLIPKHYQGLQQLLPKRNFDVRAETEFRCSYLEARLLSPQEKYTTYQVNSGWIPKVKGRGGRKERNSPTRGRSRV
jgi:hypothetical protein